jgi:hypothetical protein
MDYNPRTDLYEDELNKDLNNIAKRDNDIGVDELIRMQRETLKNNALFNLDFDEYKEQVKKQMQAQQKKLSELDYVRDVGAIRQQKTNIYLYIGLVLLIIAIVMVILNIF